MKTFFNVITKFTFMNPTKLPIKLEEKYFLVKMQCKR